jgi:hypothetical protein
MPPLADDVESDTTSASGRTTFAVGQAADELLLIARDGIAWLTRTMQVFQQLAFCAQVHSTSHSAWWASVVLP